MSSNVEFRIFILERVFWLFSLSILIDFVLLFLLIVYVMYYRIECYFKRMGSIFWQKMLVCLTSLIRRRICDRVRIRSLFADSFSFFLYNFVDISFSFKLVDSIEGILDCWLFRIPHALIKLLSKASPNPCGSMVYLRELRKRITWKIWRVFSSSWDHTRDPSRQYLLSLFHLHETMLVYYITFD